MGDDARRLFDGFDEQLLEQFYRSPADRSGPIATGTTAAAAAPAIAPERAGQARVRAAEKPRPTHYKICCISLYTEDIARLEAMVAELKRRGHTKANKSQIIRAALDQLDLSKIPKGY